MLHLTYRLFDLSALSHGLVLRLTYVGDLALVVGALHGYRRGRLRRALVEAVCLSLPFFAPLLVIAGSEAFGGLARLVGLPVRISGYAGGLNRTANEDVSAFGPLGTLALLGMPPLVVAWALRRRVGRDALLLALALPSFVVLVGLTASYNPFLTRFVLVPAALTAPLLAYLFSSRAVSAALLAVAAVVLYATLTKDFSEPYADHPWGFDEVAALGYTGTPQAATALAAYDRLVPRSACVGAALGTDEPSYVLFGPSLAHRVFFLPQTAPLAAARRDGVGYVVVTTSGPAAWIAGALRLAGWQLESLAGYWELAVAPAAGRPLERCASP
jgi:hypothetical protein